MTQPNKSIEDVEKLKVLLRELADPKDLAHKSIGSRIVKHFTDTIQQSKEEEREWAVKVTISQFLQMNLEDPTKPVNVDEVKRRALNSLSNTP